MVFGAGAPHNACIQPRRFPLSILPPLLAWQLPRLFGLALLYWVAARLSLNLALVHGQVTPIWPPTGIAVVAILLMGRRVWPAIAVAAFAVNLPIGPSPLGVAAIAAGNTLAPLVAAEILRRAGFHPELDRVRDALAIIAAALLGMTISASCGTAVLALSGAIAASSAWPTWAVWWTGDAMGVLLVAPFLLSLRRRASQAPLTWARSLELAAILFGTGLTAYILFQNRLRLEYLVFPLIMAAAWRFRLRGAAPAALLASGVAVWSAVNGAGSFDSDSLAEKMITLQVFNVGVALTSFLLAAFVETRERQEQMARLYMSERLASEAKSAFLNMAAHELRTPVSVLNGYLSMLLDGSLGPPPGHWRRALEILNAKIQEVNKLVADLLDTARLEASPGDASRSEVDLRTVVAEAVERAQPRADLLQAELAAALGPDAVLVVADAEQVGRILDNLINNALTYTACKPRVSITLARSEGYALARVADNGVGIPSGQRERVFERFYRCNEPEFRHVRGTGLGLYISRRLAEAHGGSLTIESSEPGQGTAFALALPVSSRAAGAGEAGKPTKSARTLPPL
jgi:signal transduction histidine kinase